VPAKRRSSLALVGQALIQDLQAQGRYEAALSRFRPDDDEPRCPDVDALSSAQSRRLPVEVH
jgi:hypothetical protein